MARSVLKQWKKETAMFLEYVREKGEMYLLPL